MALYITYSCESVVRTMKQVREKASQWFDSSLSTLKFQNSWNRPSEKFADEGLCQAKMCYSVKFLIRRDTWLLLHIRSENKAKIHSAPLLMQFIWQYPLQIFRGSWRNPTPKEICCGPYLLWPNGWVDQNGIWHGSRPLLRSHWATRGPSSAPKKGAGPHFRPIFIVAKRLDASGYHWHGGRPQPRRLCVRWGPNPLSEKGRSPQFSAQVYCGQTAALIKMPLGTEVGLGLCDIVLDGDTAPPP